ncbi:MAG: hypothetical protein AAF320_03650, partial [Myxococcota bacterium]
SSRQQTIHISSRCRQYMCPSLQPTVAAAINLWRLPPPCGRHRHYSRHYSMALAATLYKVQAYSIKSRPAANNILLYCWLWYTLSPPPVCR